LGNLSGCIVYCIQIGWAESFIKKIYWKNLRF
jgi:hypothetical protein